MFSYYRIGWNRDYYTDFTTQTTIQTLLHIYYTEPEPGEEWADWTWNRDYYTDFTTQTTIQTLLHIYYTEPEPGEEWADWTWNRDWRIGTPYGCFAGMFF